MNKKNSKIIDDTLNYLKFYKDYKDYSIYKDEITISGLSAALNTKKTPGKNQLNESPTVTYIPEQKRQINLESPVVKSSIDSESWINCNSLESFANEIRNCPKCEILSRTRKQVVFGTGNPKADIVVVGEAPGADEDVQGKPFVGRAGKLLTDILSAINFSREEVYICNILKCRPPENRNPLPDEIANCEPYLFKQLEMIKPMLILAVGTFAAQTLLKTKEPLGKMRGKFHICNGIKMMVTYHPAALLRNPNWKRPAWEDVKLLRMEYDKLKNLNN